MKTTYQNPGILGSETIELKLCQKTLQKTDVHNQRTQSCKYSSQADQQKVATIGAMHILDPICEIYLQDYKR